MALWTAPCTQVGLGLTPTPTSYKVDPLDYIFCVAGQFGMVYQAHLAENRGSNDYGPITHKKVAVKSLKGE